MFWFNLKCRLLRLRHGVSFKASVHLGLIPFPLHPILVCYHDRCSTKKFDARTLVMLALLTCLVCMIFFNVFWVVYCFFLGSQSPSFLHLSSLDCCPLSDWIELLVGYIYIYIYIFGCMFIIAWFCLVASFCTYNTK